MTTSKLKPTKYRGIRAVATTDKSGRPHTRYRVVYDAGTTVGGKRKQITRTVDTLQDARLLRARAEAELADGTHVTPDLTRLDEHLATWLAGKRNLAESTRQNYVNALKVVSNRLGGKTLQRLRRADVEELVTYLLLTGGRNGTGRSTPTVRLALSLLAQALDAAVRQHLLPSNPARGVELPKRVAPILNTWTGDEAARFLDAVADDRLAAGWCLTMYGLRRSEVLGLRWSDLDLNVEPPTITIRRARVLTSDGTISVGEPKTERSKRTLPLDRQLARDLRSLRARQLAEIADLEVEDSDYIVTGVLGRPVRPEWWSDEFRHISTRAHLRPIRLHDARHTAGTLMHLRAVPTAVISAWLGHHSPAFTMRVYVHSQDAALIAGRAVLASSLRRQPTQS